MGKIFSHNNSPPVGVMQHMWLLYTATIAAFSKPNLRLLCSAANNGSIGYELLNAKHKSLWDWLNTLFCTLKGETLINAYGTQPGAKMSVYVFDAIITTAPEQ